MNLTEMNIWFCDSEVFAYDTLWVFKSMHTGEYKVFHNDNLGVFNWLQQEQPVLCGWNLYNYDMHIMRATLCDWTPEQHKMVNDTIINGDNRLAVWQLFQCEDVPALPPNIDLFHDIVPRKGLKEIEANLGMSIEESTVPFDLDRPWTEDEKADVIFYCKHDVDATEKVYHTENRQDYIEAKMVLAELTGVDPFGLLPVSNAKGVALALGAEKRMYVNETYTLPDNMDIDYIPDCVLDYATTICTDLVELKQDEFREAIETQLGQSMTIEKGSVVFGVGGCQTKVGVGGIHAALPNYVAESDDEYVVLIQDVSGYYPSLILENNYMSRGVPSDKEYREFRDIRLKAKKAGNKRLIKAPKLVQNVLSGAMGDKYNKLYDPFNRVAMCLSGQLYMIELVNRMVDEIDDFTVIQLNTDGWVIRLPRKSVEKLDLIVGEWYNRTHFEVETDEIKKIIQRDVNNYIIEFADGEKGVKAIGGTVKYYKGGDFLNKSLTIVHTAVLNKCLHGIPIEDTINSCDDLSQFQIVAKGGSYGSCIHGELVREKRQVVDSDGTLQYTKTGKPQMKFTLVGYDGDLIQKVNRVYATTDTTQGSVFKVKLDSAGEILMCAKVSEVPDHCFVDNKGGEMTFDLLDREFYIEMANRKAKAFMDEGEDEMAEAKTPKTPKAPKAKAAEKVAEVVEQVEPKWFLERYSDMCELIRESAKSLELDKDVAQINYSYVDTQKYKQLLGDAAAACGINVHIDFAEERFNPDGVVVKSNTGNIAVVISTAVYVRYQDKFGVFEDPTITHRGFGVGQNFGNANYAAGGAQTSALRNYVINEFLLNNQGYDGDDVALSSAPNQSGTSKTSFVSTGERAEVAKAVTANKPETATLRFAEAILENILEIREVKGQENYGQKILEKYFVQEAEGWIPKEGSEGMSLIDRVEAQSKIMPKVEAKLETLQS